MRARPFRWLVCLLVLHAATGQASEGVSASERLELARQKLAEQALRASARVDAISWIDSSGRLHEHQSLRQSLHWPGPLDAAQGAGRDLLLEGQRAPTGCAADVPATGLYPTLALSTRWPTRLSASQRDRLTQTVRLQWLGNDDAARPWRMFQAATAYPSTYEQRLLAPPAPDSDWRAELRLESQPSVERGSERLQWRLSLLHHNKLVAQQHVLMDLPVLPQAWGPALWTEASWQAIEQQLSAWAELLNRQMACVRPQPQLEAGTSGGWQLNMGRLAGLQVGDEWVLVDPAWLPDRALEPGAIGKMVVARVVRVDDSRAELVTLAGDPRLPRPGWVAHPLNLKAAGLAPPPGLRQARR